MPVLKSALVVLVPEAEAMVGNLRDTYDPSATAGAPPHITLLYPFKHPHKIRRGDLDQLRRCAAHMAPFEYSLAAMRRFPGVLYFAPEPADAFRRLTTAIWDRFPETPPYGGKYPVVTPHLTVAQIANERQLDDVATELSRRSEGKLPIAAQANEMALLDTTSGRWRVQTIFKFG